MLAALLLSLVLAPAIAEESSRPPETVTEEAGSGGGEKPAKGRIGKGHRAPDFQYQSADQLWQNLHNLLEHGDLLLVFGASDVDLRSLEREREPLLKSGITPFAVVERKERDVWASVRRLGLTYSLLADPRGVIGSQFGVYDPGTGRSRSSWFVIDRKGRVRQCGDQMPKHPWPTVAMLALGRKPSATQSAASR